MEPVQGLRCGLTSSNPKLVKAGDSVLPCLTDIVEGKSDQIPECRKQSRLCRNWAMRAIDEIGTPRAKAFFMSLAGTSDDADLLIGAAGALANLHVQQAIPILYARLNSENARVRAQLVMSLGILQAREHTADLVRTALGLKPDDFYNAAHGFRFLGDPSVVPALRKYVDAMPPSDRRDFLIGQVNDIGVVANFQAGIEQKNAEHRAWAESYFRAAIDEGERAGVRSQTLGDAYYELGDLCRKAARFDEAETMFGRTTELWQGSLPLGNDKRFELEIARALVRDARGMDRDGAKKIAWIARVLHAVRPERRQALESQFPEMRGAFVRYESYCRANKLQGCQQDLSEYVTR
jgi:tetratricopeptide (TPR) repeat protein